MTSLISRVAGYMMIGMCFFSLNVMFVSFTIMVRRSPNLVRALRRALGWALLVSYQFYRILLRFLAPSASRLLAVDVTNPFPRTSLCIVFTLVFGLVILTITGLSWRVGFLGVFVLHGLLVGVLWDELAQPGGVRLGEKIQ